jgi:GT2 family glycosyltransferase
MLSKTEAPVQSIDNTREIEENCHYSPTRILELELSRELPTLSAFDKKTGKYYRRAYCLVRLHKQPIGTLELTFATGNKLEPEDYAPEIWATMQEAINEHLRSDGLAPINSLKRTGLITRTQPACQVAREHMLEDAPFISVIVPTHQRATQVRACIQGLLKLDYPSYEILIVDNAPTSTETCEIVSQWQLQAPHLRYICEESPGSSCARNRGIKEARGELLAFIDDDVVVDPEWLTELAYVYHTHKEVDCVTGMIMPLELETEAQIIFERFGSWAFAGAYQQHIHNMGKHHPKTPFFPYIAGSFGAGANMSFRATSIRRLNGFDPNLGGSGPSRHGQDIDTFFRVIINGGTLIYTPAAIIYHQHRRDMKSLRKQMYGYGLGFTAYLTKNLCAKPQLIFDLSRKIPYGLVKLLQFRIYGHSRKEQYYSKELVRLEQKGMLYGPIAYFQTRRQHILQGYGTRDNNNFSLD